MSKYQYTFFRKKVAGRISVTNEPTRGVFVGFEAANVIESTLNQENPNYDWNSKIVLSLSINEVSKFVLLVTGKIDSLDLYHSTSGNVKVLKAKRMPSNGNVLINIEHTLSTGEKRTVSGISLTPEDFIIFEEIFKSAILNLSQIKQTQN